MPHSIVRIGLDLDNTIIDYDHAFLMAALERHLVPSSFKGNKQELRNHIRMLADGETRWQKLQGYVYGQGMKHARLFPGANEFVQEALKAGHELYIISHKTQFGHFDETKTDLREAALQFLHNAKLFTDQFTKAHVSFHDTRAAKVAHIATLAPHWFIDDLVEVYEEQNFPKEIRKILFHSSSEAPASGSWQICRNWQEIRKTVFA